MRTRDTWTISLPPEMSKKVEKVMKREHRTRSEFVREAIRRYLSNAELSLLDRALAEAELDTREGRTHGPFKSADALVRDLHSRTRRMRTR